VSVQEQHDQLQRQMGEAVSREAAMAGEVEAYKVEHTQLLAANAQLVMQRGTLMAQLQVGVHSTCCFGAHSGGVLQAVRAAIHTRAVTRGLACGLFAKPTAGAGAERA
jgi:hypothetical protein